MPLLIYGPFSTIPPSFLQLVPSSPTVNISLATIDSNFIDVTNNLIWWYGIQSGDISSNNSIYNYITQQYDASAVGFTSLSTSDYRTGTASIPMSSTKYIKFPSYTFNSSSTYTVTYWVKNSNNAANIIQSIFSPTNNSPGGDYNNSFLLQSASNSAKYFYTFNGAHNSFSYPNNINDNTWHLVIWKFYTNNTSQNLIVDNNTTTYSATGMNLSGFTAIGNYIGWATWDNTQYMTGFIDDYRLYSGFLSTTQIQSLYDISNANCSIISYGVSGNNYNFTINWSGTNVECVTLTNKTQNINYGRFTTSGQTYSGISWNTTDLFYLTPYNSTSVGLAKAGLATKLFNITNTSPYLYDLLSSTTQNNLRALYSFKLCVSSYTGPVVNIRRDDGSISDFYADTSGNLGQIIGATGTSLTGWLNQSSGIKTGYVVKWYDQSGYGYDLSQNNTTYQPQIITTDPNGICIYLNASMPSGSGQLTTSKNIFTGNTTTSTTTNLHFFHIFKEITRKQTNLTCFYTAVSSSGTRNSSFIAGSLLYYDSGNDTSNRTSTTISSLGTYNKLSGYKNNSQTKTGFSYNGTSYSTSSNITASIGPKYSLNFNETNTFTNSDHYVYTNIVFSMPLNETTDETKILNWF